MKTARDILSKLLDENSRGKAQSYSSVFGGWRDLAGLSLADHSRVYEIKHHNLFVEVDHNGWMQILLLRKARILAKLRSRYPELEIRDLKIRINPSMSPVPSISSPPASSSESSGESQTGGTGAVPSATLPPGPGAGASSDGGEDVEQIVSEVSQETLKQQLRKLFLSSLKHKRGSA